MAQFVELLLEIGFVKPELALPAHSAHAHAHRPQHQPPPSADKVPLTEPAESGEPAAGEGRRAAQGTRRGRQGRGRGREAYQAGSAPLQVEAAAGHATQQPDASLKGQAAVKALMRSRPIGGAYYNVHADSLPCLRAVLCAGLYPNVVRSDESEERRTPRFEGPGGASVALHPSTANADIAKFESRWLVYYEKVQHACGCDPDH